MGLYERMREERGDATRGKKRRKTQRRQLSAIKRIREDHGRKKSRAWRYYKAAAIARKSATKKEGQ